MGAYGGKPAPSASAAVTSKKPTGLAHARRAKAAAGKGKPDVALTLTLTELIPLSQPAEEEFTLDSLEGHVLPRVSIVTSLPHKRFAVIDEDGRVGFWCAEAGAFLAGVRCHSPVASACAAGTCFASACLSGLVQMWSLESFKLLREIRVGADAVQHLTAGAPDSGSFCCCGANASLQLWAAAGGELQSILRGERLATPACMVYLNADQIVTGEGSKIFIYSTVNKTHPPNKLELHRESVTAICAVGERSFYSGSQDGVVVLWNSIQLFPISVLCFPDQYRAADESLLHPVTCMCQAQKSFFIVARGCALELYSLQTHELIAEVPQAHASKITRVLYHSERDQIFTVAQDMQISAWQFVPAQAALPGPAGVKPETAAALKQAGRLVGHQGAALWLVQGANYSLLSVSSENEVFWWKDGLIEHQIRSILVSRITAQLAERPSPDEAPTPAATQTLHRSTDASAVSEALD
mmetsp:Transcript_29157/g.73318  ORF Transcript_29157/g.73318 Transcript_29157/m.73318 type:complete len:468 (-) Transcript_29157:497-1900(-)